MLVCNFFARLCDMENEPEVGSSSQVIDEYDDDEEEGAGFSDFERLLEASTVQALLDLEQRLHYPNQENDIKKDVDDSNDENFRRYAFGYEAHNDTADDKEVYNWQNHFNYIRPECIPLGFGSGVENVLVDKEEEVIAKHGYMSMI